MAKKLKVPAIAAGLILYPFVSAFLVREGWSRLVLLLFAAPLVRRAVLAETPARRFFYGVPAGLLAAGAWLAEDFTARLIPAFVHLSLAGLFGYTLVHPPTLIERMVRLHFPEFKPGIAEYLRQLTWIWAGFFAVNVVVCAGLAGFADDKIWMAYTGFWVYLPMVALAVGEHLYRPRRFPGLEMPGPMETFRIMARNGHRIFQELRG